MQSVSAIFGMRLGIAAITLLPTLRVDYWLVLFITTTVHLVALTPASICKASFNQNIDPTSTQFTSDNVILIFAKHFCKILIAAAICQVFLPLVPSILIINKTFTLMCCCIGAMTAVELSKEMLNQTIYKTRQKFTETREKVLHAYKQTKQPYGNP